MNFLSFDLRQLSTKRLASIAFPDSRMKENERPFSRIANQTKTFSEI
jgi:hypothetical protein